MSLLATPRPKQKVSRPSKLDTSRSRARACKSPSARRPAYSLTRTCLGASPAYRPSAWQLGLASSPPGLRRGSRRPGSAEQLSKQVLQAVSAGRPRLASGRRCPAGCLASSEASSLAEYRGCPECGRAYRREPTAASNFSCCLVLPPYRERASTLLRSCSPSDCRQQSRPASLVRSVSRQFGWLGGCALKAST